MPDTSPRVDHVVINVAEELDAAQRQYQKLGFFLTLRGHHTLGSSNHLAIFDNNYLELLGYEAKNVATIPVGVAETARGFSGLAFKTRDADALFNTLKARGVTLGEHAPNAFSRPVDLGDGSAPDIHFRTFRLDPGATPKRRYFFCQNLDPELLWRKEWQQHPNGVLAISRVVVEAKDPAASIALFAQTFGKDSIRDIADGYRLQTPTGAVEVITREAAATAFGNALPPRENDDDRKIALTLRVRSLVDTRQLLKQNGVSVIDKSATSLIVPANEAFGLALEFIS
ncbi:hypothetical protein FACS1894116_07020 [Betaproteobacteria bacterium]|nr:hypothetical protein AGMMS49543_14030 [Betaproteobacteria bacterium]GHT93930.1 hypothetical protein FACS1894116_07020 [Betaproteobacteria bacterium]GHU00563.1 hypothetical protein AGMMS49960_08880 [Betaproteobacteria bacterium]GHU08235.1 hypothetical protein AGMMS50225_06500 [Betaproteobacteria bacterium]GHU20547.1 hypothetical protein AGMMS50243_15540 [Betaproteobacteria bacterium]